MTIFKKNLKIKLSVLILLILIILCIAVIIWFSYSDNPKILAILGSLFAGIIVAIIQFLISWQDYKSTEKLKDLQINEVLFNRDKREFYENYIDSAKESIDMMGVTGSRFMEHFANNDEDAPENSRILLKAMNSRDIEVRILIPKKKFLFTDTDKRKEESARERYEKISKNYPNNFFVKYFSHVPAHSIFKVDDECIVGPVFPKVQSKYTPALYIKNKSPFAKKYLKYFNDEWKNAESLKTQNNGLS
mgnify:FL=1